MLVLFSRFFKLVRTTDGVVRKKRVTTTTALIRIALNVHFQPDSDSLDLQTTENLGHGKQLKSLNDVSEIIKKKNT